MLQTVNAGRTGFQVQMHVPTRSSKRRPDRRSLQTTRMCLKVWPRDSYSLQRNPCSMRAARRPAVSLHQRKHLSTVWYVHNSDADQAVQPDLPVGLTRLGPVRFSELKVHMCDASLRTTSASLKTLFICRLRTSSVGRVVARHGARESADMVRSNLPSKRELEQMHTTQLMAIFLIKGVLRPGYHLHAGHTGV
jgi:hypothetical protein